MDSRRVRGAQMSPVSAPAHTNEGVRMYIHTAAAAYIDHFGEKDGARVLVNACCQLSEPIVCRECKRCVRETLSLFTATDNVYICDCDPIARARAWTL